MKTFTCHLIVYFLTFKYDDVKAEVHTLSYVPFNSLRKNSGSGQVPSLKTDPFRSNPDSVIYHK